MNAGAGESPSHRSRLVALLLFAAAMGWLEGVVVVYIRSLIGLAHGPVVPSPAEVMERFHRVPWLLPTEQAREAATLVMLVAVAWLGGGRARERFGAFLMMFGAWDIVYYIALFTMLGWPPSLAAVDVLFLLPPSPLWYQPVWVPVAIAGAMVLVGARLYRRGVTAPR
jgi:hypothetical protein